MKKLLIILFILFFTTPIYAAQHTHTNECYNRITHNHNDSCYSITKKECNSCSHPIPKETIRYCSYCNQPLYKDILYTYTCCGEQTHYGQTYNMTAFVYENWEDISELTSVNEYGIIISDYYRGRYRHNCSNESGVIIDIDNKNGALNPGVTCRELIEEKKLTCGKKYDIEELICNTQIKTITAKTQYQTSKNPDFTLIITYKDEHTKEVQPKMTTFTNNAIYPKDTKIVAYYQVGNELKEISFYITTPIVSTPENTPTQISTPTPTNNPTPTNAPTPTIKTTITPIPTIENTSTPTNIVTNLQTTSIPPKETTIIETPIPTTNVETTSTMQIPTISQKNENVKTINENKNTNDEIIENENNIENEENTKTITNNKQNDIKLYIIIGVIIFIVLLIIVIFIVINKKKKVYW